MSNPNKKYPIIPEAVYWEKINRNESYIGFVHYKSGEISFILPEVVVETKALDNSNNKFTRYAMVNKIEHHEQFVPLSLACDAIRIDDADIRIKEQIMQFNTQRNGVKAKFRSFLEKKISELRRKELEFLSDSSGTKNLRMRCEHLLMKLNKNDSLFPIYLDDIPLEIYNELETVEYRRVYNIKKQEFSSPGEIRAIDPIAKFHSDIQKRDPTAYQGAQQIPMKAVAVGGLVATVPITVSTEMWGLKAGVSFFIEARTKGRETNLATVAAAACLDPLTGSLAGELIGVRPFSEKSVFEFGSFNKNNAVNVGTGFAIGSGSSFLENTVGSSVKHYKPLYYFFIIMNESTSSIIGEKMSNQINSAINNE
ncbi:hypothetical protein [Bacteroides sp. 224]|uniref:hypothetical protein n=1 Tax=Bacteroides sp. 224 TaxID=2302936 RepID=UPI0013D4CA8C|nr:hypothetical protein [Bacteroides sp. 224]NDV65215.1 hypothetical protein [Bacteroides sp. 224]